MFTGKPPSFTKRPAQAEGVCVCAHARVCVCVWNTDISKGFQTIAKLFSNTSQPYFFLYHDRTARSPTILKNTEKLKGRGVFSNPISQVVLQALKREDT